MNSGCDCSCSRAGWFFLSLSLSFDPGRSMNFVGDLPEPDFCLSSSRIETSWGVAPFTAIYDFQSPRLREGLREGSERFESEIRFSVTVLQFMRHNTVMK